MYLKEGFQFSIHDEMGSGYCIYNVLWMCSIILHQTTPDRQVNSNLIYMCCWIWYMYNVAICPEWDCNPLKTGAKTCMQAIYMYNVCVSNEIETHTGLVQNHVHARYMYMYILNHMQLRLCVLLFSSCSRGEQAISRPHCHLVGQKQICCT